MANDDKLFERGAGLGDADDGEFDPHALLKSIYDYANTFIESRPVIPPGPRYILHPKQAEFIARDMDIPVGQLTADDIDRFIAKYLFE